MSPEYERGAMTLACACRGAARNARSAVVDRPAAGREASNASAGDATDAAEADTDRGRLDATGEPAPYVPPADACSPGRPRAPGLECRSPERESWNACGAPGSPDCAAGFAGDACGHCFQGCATDVECGSGRRCNGSYCESAAYCAAPIPPYP